MTLDEVLMLEKRLLQIEELLRDLELKRECNPGELLTALHTDISELYHVYEYAYDGFDD